MNGGVAGICPTGGDLSGNNYFRRIGLSDCQDYTSSGKFQTSSTGTTYQATASLNRGWRDGSAGRNNGGWGINGAGGGGGSGGDGRAGRFSYASGGRTLRFRIGRRGGGGGTGTGCSV